MASVNSIFTPPTIGDWGFQQRMQAARQGARWPAASLLTARQSNRAAGEIIPMPTIADLLGPQSLAMTATVDDRPPAIAAVVSQCKADLDAIGQQQQQAIEQAQAGGANNQSFIDRMNAQKAQAKQQMDATIDKTYDELTVIGKQNPQSQNLIVEAMGEVGTLASAAETTMASAFDSAISACQSAINAIASAAEAAAQAAEEAAEAAANAVANAAHTVASGVEHIFSGW